MILNDQTIAHVNAVTHDGKVVCLGAAPDGTIHYTVKRGGFEDSAVKEGIDPFGFEGWRRLRLGESIPDPSVTAAEQKNLTDGDGRFLLRTVYGASEEATRSAGGPVQLVSSQNQLYVFRRSPAGKILVNRFVLDGMTNELVPRLEVRFRRSKQRLAPHDAATSKAGDDFDNLDYRDMDGQSFYEGALELGFAGTIAELGFAVLLVPTSEVDRSRWHVLAVDADSGKLVLHTVGAGGDGLFDVGDYAYGQRDPADPGVTVYRSIPGVIRRELDLVAPDGSALRIAGAPAAITYDLQREQITAAGPTLVRDAIRVMAAVPVRAGGDDVVTTAALSFALAADGTLSRIERAPAASTLLRDRARDLITPLALLDEIREVATASPPPSGAIAGMARGQDDLLVVRSEGPVSAEVQADTRVRLRGTRSLDGHYEVLGVNGSTFEIAVEEAQLGSWEVAETRASSLVFDGMIVGVEKDGTGRLVVHCSSHDLEVGQEVQISGTHDVDGVYPIAAVDRLDDSFTVDVPYFTGQAANLARVVRRGLRMGGGDRVETPGLGLPAPRPGKDFGRTLAAWVRLETGGAEQTLVGDDGGTMRLFLRDDGRVALAVRIDGLLIPHVVADPEGIPRDATWTHYSGSVAYLPENGGRTRVTLCRNGRQVAEETLERRRPWCRAPRYMSFDGARDFITVPAFATPGRALTVGVWARSATPTWNDHGCLVSKRDAFVLHPWKGTRRIELTVWIGGRSVSVGADVDDIQKWHFYAGIYTGTEIQLYVDGRPVARESVTGQIAADADGVMCIGHDDGYAPGQRNFAGQIAGVQVWSKARAWIYDDFAPDEDGLVGYWPLDADVRDATPNARHGKVSGAPRLGADDFACTIGERFDGEIADVQVWGIARTEADVKATMHLRLGGREEGLAAYYRLGGVITETDPPTVPDFSANRRDAVVRGEPYAGARRLGRASASGSKVVEYTSDELVAVSGRGVYEESFEFRVEAPPGVTVDPNDADGAGDRLFTFSYWGKQSRTSREIIRFPPAAVEQRRFEQVDEHFYRATCRVTVPDGVALMRAFELTDVRGRWGSEATAPPNEWTALRVRKHRIRFVSDAITRDRYVEALRLPSLPGGDATPGVLLSLIRGLEAQIAPAEALVADLRARLDVVEAGHRYEAEMHELVYTIERLEAQRAEAEKIIAAVSVYLDVLSTAAGAVLVPAVFAYGDLNAAYIESVRAAYQGTLDEQTARVQELDAQIKAARQRLAWLESAFHQAEDLEAQLAAAVQHLKDIRVELDSRNTQFLTVWEAAPPAAMATLATDERGLTTAGAVLEFVEPRGEVRLAETCDGNVLLTCFDADGRMRATVYDAVADSRDTTFEQWLPDGPRPCVDIGEPGRCIVIEPPVTLPPSGWTCEAWVFFPLPTRTEQVHGARAAHGVPYDTNVLASSSTGQHAPLLVRRGHRLGMLIDGWFFDGGVDLDATITDGWHHLAVATSGGSTGFYVDGVRVGGRVTLQPAMRFGAIEGKDDGVTVPAFDSPAFVTVSVWARSAGGDFADGACLVEKRGAFRLSFRGGAALCFSITASQGAVEVASPVADAGSWHHYTGTFDGRFVRLYVDGELVAEEAAAGALAAGREPMRIGASERGVSLRGDIAEVALWSEGRDQISVRDDQYRDLLAGSSGTADARGLLGYWRMARADVDGQSRVKDLTINARHGALSGAPLEMPITTLQPVEVRMIGNHAPAGESPIGRLAEVRLWGLGLSDAEVAVGARAPVSGNEPGLVAYWPLDDALEAIVRDHSTSEPSHDAVLHGARPVACTADIGNPGTRVLSLPDRGGAYVACALAGGAPEQFTFACWARASLLNQGRSLALVGGQPVPFEPPDDPTRWHHWCTTHQRSGDAYEVVMYRDGERVGTSRLRWEPGQETLLIGKSRVGTDFLGEIAEVRVLRGLQRPEEIQAGVRRRLTGAEDGLLCCYALDDVGVDHRVVDKVTGRRDGELMGSARLLGTTALPLAGADNLVAVEYSSMEISAEHKKQPLMRRFYGFAAGGAVHLLPEQRVEELSLQWIGNTQINPTLLGYVEGAPPVPSENLTLAEDYDAATRVVLTQADDVVYRWHRNEVTGSSFNTDGFVGAAWSIAGGAFIETQITDGQVGAVFNLAYQRSDARDSSVSASSSLRATDSLVLSGMLEDRPAFARLGKRWVPKNVGYALVVSGMADVFATTLKRSGRMVSYDVRPIDGVPLDVNTIPFLVNPAYTLNGSLDGMVGSAPADPRFYAHVPEMRAHYGARYPASYLRLDEAYALEGEIERQDKERESFFYNFDAADAGSLGALGEGEDGAPGLTPGSVDPSTTTTQADLDAIKDQSAQQKEESKSEAERRQAEINERQQSLAGRVRAGAAFADWQLLMANIETKAGKRNIVNTYVWDADGGLRAEEESFAGTIEHSIATDSSVSGGGGASVDTAVAGFKFALSLVGSGSSSSGSGKTLSANKSLELGVDLFGLERRGITDLRDNPLVPGEKVASYRFMTFYLEGSTDHFDDFFGHVVDPEWLASNDEDARALREAQRGKPNKCWRVLHRVTYVKRPALAVSSERARALVATSEVTQQVTSYFSSLEAQQQRLSVRIGQLDEKLDEILEKLRRA